MRHFQRGVMLHFLKVCLFEKRIIISRFNVSVGFLENSEKWMICMHTVKPFWNCKKSYLTFAKCFKINFEKGIKIKQLTASVTNSTCKKINVVIFSHIRYQTFVYLSLKIKLVGNTEFYANSYNSNTTTILLCENMTIFLLRHILRENANGDAICFWWIGQNWQF